MAKSSAHAEDFFCHFHKSYFPFPPHTNKTASLKLQLRISSNRDHPDCHHLSVYGV
jgi:hypothetical protein